jgi:septum formation topological specificity factor MinE
MDIKKDLPLLQELRNDISNILKKYDQLDSATKQFLLIKSTEKKLLDFDNNLITAIIEIRKS